MRRKIQIDPKCPVSLRESGEIKLSPFLAELGAIKLIIFAMIILLSKQWCSLFVTLNVFPFIISRTLFFWLGFLGLVGLKEPEPYWCGLSLAKRIEPDG